MILITGASGFIGNKFYRYFKKNKVCVKGAYFPTGSNLDKEDGIYLDLKNDDISEIKKIKDLSHIIFCHGISDIEACGNDKTLSYAVNVTNTIGLLRYCKYSGITPIYLSTSMVFCGGSELPAEPEDLKPASEYARQKAEVGKFITDNFSQYVVLRLTKVFGVEKGDKTLFTSWLDKLIKREKIMAASDVFISPVYVMDVIRMANLLIKNNYYGSYNLGGPEILKIYDFARRLAAFFNYDPACVKEVSISDFGFKENRPKFNSVDSTKILKDSGAMQTPIDDCFKLISKNYEVN